MKQLMGSNKIFNLIGYSFGVMLSLEVVHILEGEGYSGKVCLIDGAPDIFRAFINNVFGSDPQVFQTKVLLYTLEVYVNKDILEDLQVSDCAYIFALYIIKIEVLW